MGLFAPIQTQGAWNGQATGPVGDTAGTLPQGNQLYQQGGPNPYPFPTQAWFNPLQEQGYETSLMGAEGAIPQALQNQALAHSLQAGFNQYLQGAQMGATPGYINQIGGSFDPFNNPALDEAVSGAAGQMVDIFNRQTNPAIEIQSLNEGNFGGSRQGVIQANKLNDLGRNIADMTGQMYNQGFQNSMQNYVADRNNTLDAWLGARGQAGQMWGQAPNIAGMTMGANLAVPGAMQSLGNNQALVGSHYQGMSNAMLGEQKRMWDEFQAQPYDNLSWYSGIVGSNPGAGYSTQTGTSSPGSASMLPTIAGIGSTVYGLGQENGWWGGGGGGMSAPPMNTSNPWMPGGDLGAVGNFGGNWWA